MMSSGLVPCVQGGHWIADFVFSVQGYHSSGKNHKYLQLCNLILAEIEEKPVLEAAYSEYISLLRIQKAYCFAACLIISLSFVILKFIQSRRQKINLGSLGASAGSLKQNTSSMHLQYRTYPTIKQIEIYTHLYAESAMIFWNKCNIILCC